MTMKVEYRWTLESEDGFKVKMQLTKLTNTLPPIGYTVSFDRRSYTVQYAEMLIDKYREEAVVHLDSRGKLDNMDQMNNVIREHMNGSGCTISYDNRIRLTGV